MFDDTAAPNTASQDVERGDDNQDSEELDAIRHREITSSAISGCLLLMLKWFKRSRMFSAICRFGQTFANIIPRHIKIRIHDTVTARFKLSSSYIENVHTPGDR